MKQGAETVQLDGAVPNKRFNGVNQHHDRFNRVPTMSSRDDVCGSVGIHSLACPLLITQIRNNTILPSKLVGQQEKARTVVLTATSIRACNIILILPSSLRQHNVPAGSGGSRAVITQSEIPMKHILYSRGKKMGNTGVTKLVNCLTLARSLCGRPLRQSVYNTR